MKKNEVPQDAAILDNQCEMAYAVDEDGRYVLTPTAGWDPANLANLQAWQTIAEDIDAAIGRIKSGGASPLAFHMARNQMNACLLARYSGVAVWRVRRHLKPRHYKSMSADQRQRYAEVFRCSVEDLDRLPERVDLPVELDLGTPGQDKIDIDFNHRQSAHCESGVTANLFSYGGQAMSEAMAFGIGSGLFFGYFPFVRINHLPLVTFRGAPGAIFKNCARRCGCKVRSRTFRNAEQAMLALDKKLEEGIPTGLQTGVYWLPYFPPALRFHFNAHNLIVCGRDGDDYLISDPLFETKLPCPRQDLIRARFAKGALAPRGRMYWLFDASDKVDMRSAVRTAIRDVSRRMVGLPVPIIGVRGMRFLASRLEHWQERLGRKRAIQHLGHLIRMQEEIGTGGGGFRFIYAAFLQEAAEILNNPKMTDLADEMTASGDLWRRFALLGARNCKGRNSAESSFPALAGILRDCADREEQLFKALLQEVR